MISMRAAVAFKCTWFVMPGSRRLGTPGQHLGCVAGGCPGRIRLEVGPRRHFQATKEGDASISVPGLRDTDLHHDFHHTL